MAYLKPVHSIATALTGAILAAFVGAASAQDATDRLGVPGPIAFDGTDFALAWTSRPTETYTKQEYLPAGEELETYESMVILEVISLDLSVNQALATQVQMLNERKASDPIVNMAVLQNEQTGEVILDFVLSENDLKDKYVVEWNAYRYVPRKPDGVTLFAISRRAYGSTNVRTFLGELRDLRTDQIDKIARMKLPEANPK